MRRRTSKSVTRLNTSADRVRPLRRWRAATSRGSLVFIGAALFVGASVGYQLAAAPGASATTTTLYAYAGGTGSTSGCAQSTSASEQCSLTAALSQAAAGDIVALETAGTQGSSATYYVGNFQLGAGTPTDPVTIEPAPGVSSPILDGDAQCIVAACSGGLGTGSILAVGNGVGVSLSGLTMQDGFASSGGAIVMGHGAEVTATTVVFSNDASNGGGAIDSGDGAGAADTVQVTDSTFINDSSGGSGGAISNGTNGGTSTLTITDSTFTDDGGNFAVPNESGGSDEGGAIDNGDGSGTGTAVITGSTFSGNETAVHGGAIANGIYRGTGTLTVANSTFSDNGADTGGAIASGDEGTGTLSVVASTFSGDTAEGSGGGIESGTSTTAATALVAADIFSGSSCDQGGGTWTDHGYNVAGDTSCFSATPATGDQNGGTSLTTQLGSLGDNGGPTQTMMPLSGNPAIADIPLDATPLQVTQADGDAFTLCPVTADQRGDASPAGAACTAGAVQVAGLVTTPNTTAITLNGAPTTLTDTAVLSSGGNPTGTITFTLEYNAATVDTETATVSGNGSYSTPTGYTLPASGTVTGTYQWDASYSGDANNVGATDDDAPGERVTVSAASPHLSTMPEPASLTLHPANEELFDAATLVGGFNATGTITFTLEYNGATVDTETATVSGDGTYSTPDGYFGIDLATGTVTGTYQWNASYSGDANNNAMSDNGSPSEASPCPRPARRWPRPPVPPRSL